MKMNTTTTIDEDRIDEDGIDEDGIEEILLRLPLKYLVRCKSVCKKWCYMIESSAFFKARLKHGRRHDRILLKYFDNDRMKDFVSCYDTYESMASPPPRALDFDITESGVEGAYGFELNFASCAHSNGIVCLTQNSLLRSPIILFNPALREFKTLPPCPFHCPNPHRCSDCCEFVAHGFGFDAAINNFKVVRMIYRKVYQDCHIEAQVYDLSTKFWRKSGRIHIVFNYHSITPPPVFFNGILHYTVVCCRIKEQQHYYMNVILTFNISTELFEIMEFPSNWKDCYVEANIESSIFMADESTLALVACTDPLGPEVTCVQLDVWLMKEYGVRESWTKHYSVMSPDFAVGRPLSFLEKDKLLFITIDAKFICYDLPTNQQRLLRQFQLDPKCFCRFDGLLWSFGVVICNESGSLLSIKNL